MVILMIVNEKRMIDQKTLDEINRDVKTNIRLIKDCDDRLKEGKMDEESYVFLTQILKGEINGFKKILQIRCYDNVYYCEKEEKFILCKDCKKCKIVDGHGRNCN